MRVVTFDALHAGVVCFGVDARDTMPLACRIREIGVTAQAKFAAAVNGQFFRFIRMVHHRPVAIFTRNYSVKLFSTNLDDGAMARAAEFVHSLTA